MPEIILSHNRSEYKSFHLSFIGKIRDPLHDTIPFTAEELRIIDSREFQRLRRIRQTAFSHYVFPGANHSRFEHSLGTMHVAGLMLSALIENQTRLLHILQSAYEQAPLKLQESFHADEARQGSLLSTQKALLYLEQSPYLAQCLRFAALLHDCGHAPFSHSGERFMATWGDFEKELPQLKLSSWLKTAFIQKIQKLSKHLPNTWQNSNIRHEVYTLFIIDQLFIDIKNRHLSPQMAQDICSVLDLSVLPYPEGPLQQSGLQSLLHEIVSGEIDADRMDYLLRDSRQSGVVYGYFDLGRILDSIGFYKSDLTKSYHLAIRRSGISAFEDYLRARWSMYQQVYFHKTVTACEAMLENIKKKTNYVLPLDLESYLQIDDANFHTQIKTCSNNPSLHNMLDDLVFNRCLWKRVYEECIPVTAIRITPSLCPAIVNYLGSQNLNCEIVENTTNLTRFSPKGRDIVSKNNFKIILKNEYSLRSLEPIENHSTLINRLDEEVIIKRIFINRYDNQLNIIDNKKIQREISDKIINPQV